MPATPPGCRPSRGRPARSSARFATTTLPRALERHECGRQLLLRRHALERVAARRLEVHRHARRERGDPLDLRLLGAGHELHVDVPGELVPDAKHLEHGDQIVHHLFRTSRDPGRDEQPLTPSASQRAEEDANELLRLEKRPPHCAIAAHGAVVTIERARVRHEDAQQLDRPARSAEHANVEWTQGSRVTGVAESRRQWPRRFPAGPSRSSVASDMRISSFSASSSSLGIRHPFHIAMLRRMAENTPKVQWRGACWTGRCCLPSPAPGFYSVASAGAGSDV